MHSAIYYIFYYTFLACIHNNGDWLTLEIYPLHTYGHGGWLRRWENKRLESFCSILFLGVKKSIVFGVMLGMPETIWLYAASSSFINICMGTPSERISTLKSQLSTSNCLCATRRAGWCWAHSEKKSVWMFHQQVRSLSTKCWTTFVFHRLSRNGMEKMELLLLLFMGVPCYM